MKTIKSLSLFLALFWLNMAWGYDIFMNVTGTIIARGCTLDAESELLEVDMQEVNRTQLSFAGAKTSEIPFTIKLHDCAASVTGAIVKFTGQSDADNNQFLGLSSGGARGVAIKIMDDDKAIIPINTTSKNYPFTGGHDAELQFYAQYVATGPSIIPGDANATATYTVTFP
ncbi:fimbrial protein [Serratia fonticola]|uniref:fimbrial protein n=1 Tax=Serratia fonticola TaxID=47917 RepID=UPI000BFBB1BF|nr:fimbrial protein [Serratia fonticola]ATM74954.1 fimbrial protein [Serratia fonticola]